MSSITKDEIRGKEYPAYTVVDNYQGWVDDNVWDELKGRTLGADPIPCIFPVAATAPLNSAIAVALKDRLKKKLLTFLVDDNTEEEHLIKAGNKDILDQNETGVRAYLLQSHLQTTLLINECISLETTFVGGLVKLIEPEGARKDRFTALAYLNYYVSKMDIDLLRDRRDENDDEAFLAMFQHS